MLIADVYAATMQMMKFNLQPTVNIQRAQVTKIHVYSTISKTKMSKKYILSFFITNNGLILCFTYGIFILQNITLCVILFCLKPNVWAGQRSQYSDWLQAGRSGDQIPVGARFSAPVQTGPGAHLASCTMSTGFFPGGKKRPRRDADPSPPSSAVGHERVELYLYSPYGLYGLYRASVPVQG